MKRCFCGNDKLSEYSTHYYKCDRCKVLVSKNDFDKKIYTVTEEDNDLYGGNYWQKVMVEEAGVRNIDELIDMYISERAIYWLKNILKYTKLGGRLAEVGCGLGQLSYLLKQAGDEQTAFELSPEICKLIKEKLDINVVCGELSCSNESYDTIVAIDVFEHLLDPEQFLENCRDRLNENGVLVLQMPCYDETLTYAEMKEKKPKFEHLLVPEQHTFLYSRVAIKGLLQKHGFNSIVFEQAFFGDDYDMFLFASTTVLPQSSKEEIDSYLNGISEGRLIKAIINVYEEKEKAIKEKNEIDQQRNQLLADVEILTDDVKKTQEERDEIDQQRNQLLADVETLTDDVKKIQKERDEIDKQRTQLLADVEILTDDVKKAQEEKDEINKQRNQLLADVKVLTDDVNKIQEEKEMFKKAAEERMDDIRQLSAMIDELTQKNEILQQAADERLKIIDELNARK